MSESDLFRKVSEDLFQANLLSIVGAVTGIIGTITGAIGLIVSWFNFRYNTPKIEIDKMSLIVPNWAETNLKGKSLEELKNHFISYELEIVLRNKQGGPGSVDKPNLLISLPREGVFKKPRLISVSPRTEHVESRQESLTVTEVSTIRDGRAFNLTGGGKVDDRLEYWVNGQQDLFDVVNNFCNLQYFVEYSDNSGKKYRKRILSLVDKHY